MFTCQFQSKVIRNYNRIAATLIVLHVLKNILFICQFERDLIKHRTNYRQLCTSAQVFSITACAGMHIMFLTDSSRRDRMDTGAAVKSRAVQGILGPIITGLSNLTNIMLWRHACKIVFITVSSSCKCSGRQVTGGRRIAISLVYFDSLLDILLYDFWKSLQHITQKTLHCRNYDNTQADNLV